ncbi:MAG: hypothetical protein VKJ66_02190 [Synechococcus sp.]|nr:hypothetical protein [Synechococcus sp.]
MGQRSSCRSCRHCTPPRGEEMGWCQLRRLAIHPELAADLSCAHWTARPPRLPRCPAAVPQGQLSLAVTPDEDFQQTA